MQDCSPVEISMKLKLFITLNKAGDSDEASLKNLQQIIEKLMYIACSTQSDIVFTVVFMVVSQSESEGHSHLLIWSLSHMLSHRLIWPFLAV